MTESNSRRVFQAAAPIFHLCHRPSIICDDLGGMSVDRPQRKLAAILAADVVSYSSQMAVDESGTLTRLKALRSQIVDPFVATHRGRLFKTMGDGFLVEFASTVEALQCALAIQSRLEDHAGPGEEYEGMQLRIGLHQGDVVVDGSDLLGDGVNVAARLEALSEPGGICISARVREDARGRLEIAAEDMGEQTLKNITRAIRVYRIRPGNAPSVPGSPTLALPDKPSIAVLPFQNMSTDPGQDYLADGIVEDITTALSRIGGLFVIARNSSFTYKGRAVDVRQVGRELGVRYVLEGSVRKAVGRVRITCQLINAVTGAHVWADRFDSSAEDIFDLQDRVTMSVAGVLEPTLRNAEIERVSRRPTENMGAYDLYLRARHHYDQFTRADLEEALNLLRRAIVLDPEFSLAKALFAWCIVFMENLGWCHRDGPEVAEAIGLARAALVMSRDDPTTLRFAGHAIAYLALDSDTGRVALDRAIALNPNSSHILGASAWIRLYTGEWAEARDEFIRAIRLSPLDPEIRFGLIGLAHALVELGEVEQALDLVRKASAAGHGENYAIPCLIHCLVLLCRVDEAKEIVRRILQTNPNFSLAAFQIRLAPFHNRQFRERRLATFRAAGVPEG